MHQDCGLERVVPPLEGEGMASNLLQAGVDQLNEKLF